MNKEPIIKFNNAMALGHRTWTFEKDKIAACIFTFKDDEPCLHECVRALRRLQKKHNIEIFIFDDSEHPIENVPEGVHYRKTYFDRKGNLNGEECAQGQMIEFLIAARQCQAEYILKIDCDTIIRSLDRFLSPLKVERDSVVGFQITRFMDYCAGSMYLLPTVKLYNAIRNFVPFMAEERTKSTFISHVPEDRTITRCVMAQGSTMRLFDNVEHPENWIFAPYNFRELDTETLTASHISLRRYCIYDVVNFGNRQELMPENARAIAGKAMKLFNDMEENK